MKTGTTVDLQPFKSPLLPDSGIMMMGSCFSTETGTRLKERGIDVALNPFGILFNPSSICSSLLRLESRKPFTMDDVIERDAQYCSFFHHGSFRKPSPQEFLSAANASLAENARYFERCGAVILTFGTAWVFRHIQRGIIVSNCHKVPAREFVRERLEVGDIVTMLSPIIANHRDKHWIFTVSPIRHMADGAHGNMLSKATLLLAVERLQKDFSDCTDYFPAYEIMMDSLREDRWYAEDLVHPSKEAADYIFEAFLKTAFRHYL